MEYELTPLAKQVRRYLDAEDYHYIMDGPGHFLFTMTIASRLNQIMMRIFADHDTLTIIGEPLTEPRQDDKELIGRMALKLHHFNFGMRAGSFDIDPDDGQTLYRVGAPYKGGDVPSFETLRFMLGLVYGAWTFHGDEYLRMLVSDGGSDADADDADDEDDVIFDDDDFELDDERFRRLLIGLFGDDDGDVDDDDVDDDDGTAGRAGDHADGTAGGADPDGDTRTAADRSDPLDRYERMRATMSDDERDLLRSADELYRCGREAMERDDPRHALACYRGALSAFHDLDGRIPEYHIADVRFSIAEAQLRLKDDAAAKREFIGFLGERRAIRAKYHPDRPFADYKVVAAHEELSRIYRAEGDEEQANRETVARDRARVNLDVETPEVARVNGYCY
ncbi:YbjN domain-containing protein [Bifidobacterium platyrrhinorum]|uniref:YbjN domain-containing protein n=1 Tax=Bifidobacterium platyrrhinorum TaxID=2661628 RepID=A0A6L9SSN1_9BIFI|nr:YbjN domain-containing protein [Bifidobacterium platyrrhinorum]NEG55079.1 hypothetical protein [Bifidobacterium platyrrhinorum]